MPFRFFGKTTLIFGFVTSGLLHAEDKGWQPLLNEKLVGWETWLGRPHASVQGLPADLPVDEKGRRPPLGLGNDPKGVFTISMQDGEPVLRISGEIYGALTTTESFSNYHFRTQIKWGEAKWEPRLERKRDNGILYHCTGDHGSGGNWKKSLEFQVQEQDMGDLWPVAGTRATVRTIHEENDFFYDPEGVKRRFGEANVEGVTKAHVAHLRGDFEKPHGEWNTLDLYVVGRDAIHVVNGTVVLVLQNASSVDKQTKKETPLTSGQIQIQSEGAECFYRRMEMRPLEAFPAAIREAAGL